MKIVLLNAKLPYMYNTIMSLNCVNHTSNSEKLNAYSSIWLNSGLLREKNFVKSSGPSEYASHLLSSCCALIYLQPESARFYINAFLFAFYLQNVSFFNHGFVHLTLDFLHTVRVSSPQAASSFAYHMSSRTYWSFSFIGC